MAASTARRERVSGGDRQHRHGHQQRDERLRLIGYTRVSTDDQAANGVSLDAQAERIKAHVMAQDCDLVGMERDEGVSGKIPPRKREGLRRALDAISRGEADGLVFLKLDRLSRSVRDILDTADHARKHGWHLVSVQESIDTSTAAGRMIVTVLAALAEMERGQIGERTRMGMDQVAREGRARSGRLPFGYRIQGAAESLTVSAGDRRSLVEHAEEQRILRRMLELNDGGHGARRIARELNEDGEPNPRTGGAWTPSTVAAIVHTARRRQGLGGVPRGWA